MGLTQHELGQRLREARVATAISLEQVAEAIEISPERLAKIETGVRSVNSLRNHRLAKLYKRTLRSILVIEAESPQLP